MDRSYLSLNPVVQASRRFVCIRTLTYEDAEERDFQRALFIGGSGDVENTSFCFLSPDAKQKISYDFEDDTLRDHAITRGALTGVAATREYTA